MSPGPAASSSSVSPGCGSTASTIHSETGIVARRSVSRPDAPALGAARLQRDAALLSVSSSLIASSRRSSLPDGGARERRPRPRPPSGTLKRASRRGDVLAQLLRLGGAARRTTLAVTASPHSGSGRPKTPASATAGWASSAASTSAGATFSPPVTIVSALRPMTCRRPVSSRRPRSPVRRTPAAARRSGPRRGSRRPGRERRPPAPGSGAAVRRRHLRARLRSGRRSAATGSPAARRAAEQRRRGRRRRRAARRAARAGARSPRRAAARSWVGTSETSVTSPSSRRRALGVEASSTTRSCRRSRSAAGPSARRRARAAAGTASARRGRGRARRRAERVAMASCRSVSSTGRGAAVVPDVWTTSAVASRSCGPRARGGGLAASASAPSTTSRPPPAAPPLGAPQPQVDRHRGRAGEQARVQRDREVRARRQRERDAVARRTPRRRAARAVAAARA